MAGLHAALGATDRLRCWSSDVGRAGDRFGARGQSVACTRCGNLTRFDVERTQRIREYVHLDLAGDPTVEEREVLSETLHAVSCRWCQGDDTVRLVPRPGAGGRPQ